MDEHDGIFAEWQLRTEHQVSLVKDGIIDPMRWARAKPKVLFILKESYNDDESNLEGWDLRNEHEIKEGGFNVTFREAAHWAYCVLNNQNSTTGIKGTNKIYDALCSTAIINVKKVLGTKTSDPEDLAFYAERYGDLLIKQVNLINPDIVICGSTWDLIKPLIPHDHIGDLLYREKDNNSGRLFINFWHPANRFPRLMNCMTLMSLVRSVAITECITK